MPRGPPLPRQILPTPGTEQSATGNHANNNPGAAVARNTQHLPLYCSGDQGREDVKGRGQEKGYKSGRKRVGAGEAVWSWRAGEGMSPYLCKPFVAADCKTGQDSLE